jgi:hypothetical protein
MQKLNYQLKDYIKAVEAIAKEKGLDKVETFSKGGSVVRFELFEVGNSTPCAFWVIHHEHNKKKTVWSKEDYKKAVIRLNCSFEDLLKKIEEM